MNCPVCDERLRAVDRHGIEIDICPSCKGVWLDRGELDKILELAAVREVDAPAAAEGAGPSTQPIAPLAPSQPVNPRPTEDDPRDHREPERRGHHDDDDDDDSGRQHGRGPTDEHGEPREQPGKGRRRRGSWLSDILEGFGGD